MVHMRSDEGYLKRMTLSEHARRELLDFFKMIVWFALLFFGLRTFVVEGFEIQGNSMEPTLESNERLFVFKFLYRFDDVQRGDVIVFLYPEDMSRRFIKRVIGLPGDTVEIQDGKVLVNGQVLEEKYIEERYVRPSENVAKRTVSDGCFYVLGDHRSVSSDSRGGWVVPRNNIIGKAVLRFWPVTRIGLV